MQSWGYVQILGGYVEGSLIFFVQYHLPSCMRLLEASHVVEILREAGPTGLHVDAISEKNGVDSKKLGTLCFPF